MSPDHAPFAPDEDTAQFEPVASPPLADQSGRPIAVPPPSPGDEGTETHRASAPSSVAEQPASPSATGQWSAPVAANSAATALLVERPQTTPAGTGPPAGVAETSNRVELLTTTSPPTGSPTPDPSTPGSATPAKRRRSPLVMAAAFTLGGLVGAGGFALGQYFAEDGTAVNNPVVNVTAPAQADSTVEALPIPSTDAELAVEPAAAVAAIIGPSVVQVETNIGQGSGVVYADGLILTNHHVIEGASQVQVRASDGRVFETEVLGSDSRNDIAVLSAPDSDLPVATIGSSATLEPGQLTVAIGSPFQLQQTVTAGIVSSINRPVPNAGGGVSAMIQTDAPINPGNSGGALANRAGELVGINASIRTDGTTNANIGIGFAVPIDTAIEVADRIVDGEDLQPGVLGVTGQVEDSGIGVPIAEVTAGSGAEAAGIQPGDRILTIDGAPVTNISELTGLVQSQFSGDTVVLEVQRDNSDLTLEATLS